MEISTMKTGGPLAYVQLPDYSIYIKYSHYISTALAYPLIHISAGLHKIDLRSRVISNNALRCPYEPIRSEFIA